MRPLPSQRYGRFSTYDHDRRWIAVNPRPANAVRWVGEGYPLFRSKSKAGKLSDRSRIIRSRVTLATIDAAAIEVQVASPRTTVRTSAFSAAQPPPSTGSLT